MKLTILFLILINSLGIYSQDNNTLYIGGGKITLGMSQEKVISQYENSSQAKASLQEGLLWLSDNSNELIGVVTISNEKVVAICKEWLIDSSLDKNISHIFESLFNLLKKYDTDINRCSIELESFFDPQIESKDIIIKFPPNKSVKIQILYKDKVNIAECITSN